jgi:hypothetical protein
VAGAGSAGRFDLSASSASRTSTLARSRPSSIAGASKLAALADLLKFFAQLVEAAGAKIGRATTQRMSVEQESPRVGALDSLRDRGQPLGQVGHEEVDQLVDQ